MLNKYLCLINIYAFYNQNYLGHSMIKAKINKHF